MDSSQQHRISTVIQGFLAERLQVKLDKLKEGEEEKQQQCIEEHQPSHWIADAARRAAQIERVTHATKYSHPDAKGSSLYSRGIIKENDALIGTHSLKKPTADVVGNAAALDVYKFLRLEVDGVSLLEMAQDRSPALHAAFGGNEQAMEWIEAFARIDQPKGRPASHKLAKQLYWPVEPNNYHLLAPLFPTSLVQAQYDRLREDRFGETAKAARNARFEGKSCKHGYREYPDLAIIHFGGTQPQNISQLNSERHGEAWLLASLPPTWKRSGLKPPCSVETIFGRWLLGFRAVRNLVSSLRDFLQKTVRNNLSIRNTRIDLTRLLIDEVLTIVASVQQLPPGWSATESCRLNKNEVFWLDKGRVTIDTDFAAQRDVTDWTDAVTQSFARWINQQLDSDKTPMSDPERVHWQDALSEEMKLLREDWNHA